MDAKEPVLAQLIERVDRARSQRVPLCIRGGGTKNFYGGPIRGEPLDVTGLAGISSYEPTELVVSVRAGTPLAELEASLAEHGQCLPFEPPRFLGGGTVGGMIAAGLSGPARANLGSVRDHVLGVTLLNGRGEVLTFGGQVAKNVAGYDVSRLVVGSLGILGIICEASLKVLPVPRATATLCFDCDEGRALERLTGWASRPLPLSASAWYENTLLVRLAGALAAVNAACADLGGDLVAENRAAGWWSSLRDQTHEFFMLNDHELTGGECLWRLSMPGNSPAIEMPGRQLIEWHGAERWWRTGAAPREVRAAAASLGGHATLVRGADKSAGVFAPLDAVLMRVHRGLKQAFDPVGIFNPGRLYAEL
jgi:glycolate oxidase FAD binding subunit